MTEYLVEVLRTQPGGSMAWEPEPYIFEAGRKSDQKDIAEREAENAANYYAMFIAVTQKYSTRVVKRQLLGNFSPSS